MFKLSDYFPIMQEAAEGADDGAGGAEETKQESDGQTVLTEGTDNTQTEESEDAVKSAENEGEEKDPAEEEGENDGAPENYEFEVPEGMELDEQLSEKFTDLAKELNLTNEQANKLVSMYGDQLVDAQAKQQQQWETTSKQWAEDLKADPEFGGSNFEKNAEIAKTAIAKFGDDELKKALNDTGLGNHPALVKFMHKVGTSISEDGFDVSGETVTKKESSPQGLYSKSKMNP